MANQNWGNFTLLKLCSYGFGMIGFILAMDTVILPVLVTPVAPPEWKNTYLAVLSGSGLLVAGIMQPLVGRYSDQTRSRFGRRIPYIVWGSCFVCLGMVGLAYTPNYIALLALWLFMQVNFNIGYGPYQALIRDLVPMTRVGVASSIKILSDATGAIILIALCGILVDRATGDNIGFWMWITLGIIAAALVSTTAITSFTVWAKESAARVTQTISSVVDEPAQALHPQLRRFVISRFLIMTAVTAYPTFGLFFLKDAVGLENPAQALGLMILPIGGALALSVYPAGWLSDRIGRKPLIMAGALGAAASSVWLLRADDVTGVLVIASFMGASIGVLLGTNWALANELGTRGREALHMGIINLATTGGAAAAKSLGPGIDLLNQSADGRGYDALLITCASLFLMGGMLVLPLKVAVPGPIGASQAP